MTVENNKRIAKNTLLLYFRMLLTMGVSLFTVRVVLDTLGAVDYGLYNVVGGIVTMFSFLSGTLASASQRFFSFELGKNNIAQLKKIFAVTMTIYAMIAVLIFLLAETVGLWFLNHKMTIPVDRMEAARWVYQFSIFSFMMTMFTIPYNAIIIARENMKVYAWVSIIEAILKLLIVYILVVFTYDKLKLYAVLMFGVTTLITFIYRIYCNRNYKESRFVFYWDKALFKEILSFSGWNLFGSMAAVFKNQGINILLNVFFNPKINAARGIAYQVSTAINKFVQNFMTATSPQIIKYYAAGEKDHMNKLIFQSSKFSFFLLFILSMPLLLETRFILSIWLKQLPDYVVLFTQLVIINSMIDSLSGPLITSALATGQIKKYQIIVGGTMLLNLPVSYVFLRSGFPPQITMYVAIVIALINLFLRLTMLKKMIGLPTKTYLHKVIVSVVFTTFVSYLIPLGLLFKLEDGFVRFIIVSFLGVITSFATIYLIGLTRSEKHFVHEMIQDKILKKIK